MDHQGGAAQSPWGRCPKVVHYFTKRSFARSERLLRTGVVRGPFLLRLCSGGSPARLVLISVYSGVVCALKAVASYGLPLRCYRCFWASGGSAAAVTSGYFLAILRVAVAGFIGYTRWSWSGSLNPSKSH